jgi:hypothetical protein
MCQLHTPPSSAVPTQRASSHLPLLLLSHGLVSTVPPRPTFLPQVCHPRESSARASYPRKYPQYGTALSLLSVTSFSPSFTAYFTCPAPQCSYTPPSPVHPTCCPPGYYEEAELNSTSNLTVSAYAPVLCCSPHTLHLTNPTADWLSCIQGHPDSATALSSPSVTSVTSVNLTCPALPSSVPQETGLAVLKGIKRKQNQQGTFSIYFYAHPLVHWQFSASAPTSHASHSSLRWLR